MLKFAFTFLLGFCFWGIANSQQSSWQLTPVSILNTSGDEYAPQISRQGLLYSRNPVAGDENVGLRSELMFSAFRQNSQAPGRLFSEELSTLYHEGSACVGPGERFVVFSRNSPSKRNSRNYIYLAKSGVYDFQKAEELPYNDPRFNTTHPALDPTGKRLLFSSDRPGGFGGFDLYYAEYKDGKWSKPINLGPEVNSMADEIFPFWSENNQLAFSSNRQGGLGGFDLYLLNAFEKQWSAVKHLGAPFSSTADDKGITWSCRDGKGFVSSNRAGGAGGDDLYSFTFSEASPISWLDVGSVSTELVLLNNRDETFASLDERGHWSGQLSTYPTVKDHTSFKQFSEQLCGEYAKGGDGQPDTIRVQGIRVKVQRSDFTQSSIAGAKIWNPQSSQDQFLTEESGGVCLPSVEATESWIIEKQGFATRNLDLDPHLPYIELGLAPNSTPDSITFSHVIMAKRRIESSLADQVSLAISVYKMMEGYQLAKIDLSLLSSQTPKLARSNAAELAELISKSLPTKVSTKINTIGKSIYSDEGRMDENFINLTTEARLEYSLTFEKIVSSKRIGFNID